MNKKEMIEYLKELYKENDELHLYVTEESKTDMIPFYCGRKLLIRDILRKLGDDSCE